MSHIQIYDNIIPVDLCNSMIDTFIKNEKDVLHAPGWMDQLVMLPTLPKFPGAKKPYDWKSEVSNLDKIIDPLVRSYRSKIDTLGMLPKNCSQESYRIKRYKKNEQEFRLHVDCTTLTNSSRFLAVLIYLNDSDAGTEFPLHNITVDARQGRVVVFPPCWPWPHRGLRPQTNDKFIISTYYCYSQ